MARISDMTTEEVEERFYLSGESEINFALNELINHRTPVTVLFDKGRESFLSTLLAVWPRSRRLVFDWSGSPEINERVQRSERNIFVAHPDGIKVQFVSGPVTLIAYGDDKEQAFSVDLPTRISRLQRREYFRIITPIVDPLVLQYVAPDGRLQTYSMHDLSVAGVGITANSFPAEWQTGVTLGNCHFHLPEHPDVVTDMTICHITEQESRSGHRHFRIGLAFTALQRNSQIHLQRYIIKIEHDRHALAAS